MGYGIFDVASDLIDIFIPGGSRRKSGIRNKKTSGMNTGSYYIPPQKIPISGGYGKNFPNYDGLKTNTKNAKKAREKYSGL